MSPIGANATQRMSAAPSAFGAERTHRARGEHFGSPPEADQRRWGGGGRRARFLV